MLNGELAFLKWLEGLRSTWLISLFEKITLLGEETILILLIVGLWFAFDRREAHRLFFVTMASMTVNGIIKNLARVPRPFAGGEVTCVRPETATGYAFPSGHVQCFTTWISLVAIRLRKSWFSVLGGVLVVLVALSRLILGAHYPSDVLVGMALGVGIAFLGNALFDRVKDTVRLYGWCFAAFTPFAVLFLVQGDPHFADFFKIYGMFGGMLLTLLLEKRMLPLSMEAAWWKKALRIVLSLVIVLAVKEGAKVLYLSDAARAVLAMDALRYLLVVFAGLGLSSWLMRKTGL